MREAGLHAHLQEQGNEDDKKQDDMYSCSSKTMRMTRRRTICTIAAARQ